MQEGQDVAHKPGRHLDNPIAREAFVRECYSELFHWFCRLTGSADRAADLTQESFVAFWQAQERMPEGVSPRTWLYSIGRNLWRKPGPRSEDVRDHRHRDDHRQRAIARAGLPGS